MTPSDPDAEDQQSVFDPIPWFLEQQKSETGSEQADHCRNRRICISAESLELGGGGNGADDGSCVSGGGGSVDIVRFLLKAKPRRLYPSGCRSVNLTPIPKHIMSRERVPYSFILGLGIRYPMSNCFAVCRSCFRIRGAANALGPDRAPRNVVKAKAPARYKGDER